MLDLRREIECLRERLLDLSARNTLLNFRYSAKVLRVVDEVPNQVFSRLVIDGKAFRFLAADPEQAEGLQVKLPEDPGHESRSNKHQDTYLQTTETQERLGTKLNKLRTEAARFVEETGANRLFLALGFLEWFESRDSNESRIAPLILLPVELARKLDTSRNRYRYSLEYTGEELHANLSLQKKVADEFNIRIPDFEDNLVPEEYWSNVASVVEHEPRWAVRREAAIGFFSFSKFLMYRDLDPSHWPEGRKPHEHALISAFLGGQDVDTEAVFEPDYQDIDSNPDYDELVLPLDADSSQISAIKDIHDGRNVVIEGPPGTGKSQTITNVIANAISHGKTVLFVSEKLAALDVVFSKLKKLGLDSLVLQLHSRSARPSEIYADLDRRRKTKATEPTDYWSGKSTLCGMKESLYAYIRATSVRCGPQNEPLHEVFWRVVSLRGSLGSDVLPLPDVKHEVSLAQLDLIFRALGNFFEDADSCVFRRWRWFDAVGCYEREAKAFSKCLRQIADLVAEHETLTRKWHQDSGSDWSLDLRSRVASESLRSSEIPESPAVLDLGDPRELLPVGSGDRLLRFADLLRRYEEVEERAKPLQRQKAEEDADVGALLLWEAKNEWAVKTIQSGGLPRLAADLASLGDAVRRLREWGAGIEKTGFPRCSTLQDVERSARILDELAPFSSPNSPPISADLFLRVGQDRLGEAQTEYRKLVERRSRLSGKVVFAVLPERGRLAELKQELKTFARRRLPWLNSKYRRARRELQIAFPHRIGVDRLLTILEASTDQLRNEAIFAGTQRFTKIFGCAFDGVATDWSRLESLLEGIERLSNLGVSADLAETILEGGRARNFPDLVIRGRELANSVETLIEELSEGTPVKKAAAGGLEAVELSTLSIICEDSSKDLECLRRLLDCFVLTDNYSVETLGAAARALQERGGLVDEIRNELFVSRLFGERFKGERTAIPNVEQVSDFAGKIHSLAVTSDVRRFVLGEDTAGRLSTLRRYCQNVEELREQLSTEVRALEVWGTVDLDELLGDESETVSRLSEIVRNLDELGSWSQFCRDVDRVRGVGADELADRLRHGDLVPDRAHENILLCIYERVANSAVGESPDLARFSRNNHEAIRAEFADLDRKTLNLAARAVLSRGTKRKAPAGVQTGRKSDRTEMGLIRNEITKKKSHVPIRALFLRATRAVQALKPCVMMSPLSAARYLPANKVSFDLLVMDEASQIRPEDALGVVNRADQVVVVGDPKQLPPSRFFESDHSDEEDEDAGVGQDAESILDLAIRALRDVRRLRWHYRSQHESLIRFSNREFYDDDLVVFPAASGEGSGLGVIAHHVEGGTFESGVNVREAEMVAMAVVAHAQDSPDQTLGVGTFNRKQRDLIEDVLERICSDDPIARRAVDDLASSGEPFFVKNLENLQGDERDVIMISYTYGPDPASGKLFQRFGPITSETGWRRLNVLATRARQRVEVFSSMRPSDIQIGPAKSRGVNAMRRYLEYSLGELSADWGTQSDRGADSPFEVAVARVVESFGLKAVPQVGVVGYFIDIGVVHPELEGEYLLGIECDGASYHSAKSARDRDRLRQEIIESRGWSIHRVWSTDWYHNRESETRRLREVLIDAMRRRGLGTQSTA